MIVVAPQKRHSLVDAYRHVRTLLDLCPANHRPQALPAAPFVGELAYRDISSVLVRNLSMLGRAERRGAGDLLDYLDLKRRSCDQVKPTEWTQNLFHRDLA